MYDIRPQKSLVQRSASESVFCFIDFGFFRLTKDEDLLREEQLNLFLDTV